jgi:hypothetical protein
MLDKNYCKLHKLINVIEYHLIKHKIIKLFFYNIILNLELFQDIMYLHIIMEIIQLILILQQIQFQIHS